MIHLGAQDFERLVGIAGPYGFSCNHRLEVWPSATQGHTPVGMRHHLQGQERILDQIVKAIVNEQPSGGRFYLADDGVRLSRGHRLVALFRFK